MMRIESRIDEESVEQRAASPKFESSEEFQKFTQLWGEAEAYRNLDPEIGNTSFLCRLEDFSGCAQRYLEKEQAVLEEKLKEAINNGQPATAQKLISEFSEIEKGISSQIQLLEKRGSEVLESKPTRLIERLKELPVSVASLAKQTTEHLAQLRETFSTQLTGLQDQLKPLEKNYNNVMETKQKERETVDAQEKHARLSKERAVVHIRGGFHTKLGDVYADTRLRGEENARQRQVIHLINLLVEANLLADRDSSAIQQKTDALKKKPEVSIFSEESKEKLLALDTEIKALQTQLGWKNSVYISKGGWRFLDSPELAKELGEILTHASEETLDYIQPRIKELKQEIESNQEFKFASEHQQTLNTKLQAYRKQLNIPSELLEITPDVIDQHLKALETRQDRMFLALNAIRNNIHAEFAYDAKLKELNRLEKFEKKILDAQNTLKTTEQNIKDLNSDIEKRKAEIDKDEVLKNAYDHPELIDQQLQRYCKQLGIKQPLNELTWKTLNSSIDLLKTKNEPLYNGINPFREQIKKLFECRPQLKEITGLSQKLLKLEGLQKDQTNVLRRLSSSADFVQQYTPLFAALTLGQIADKHQAIVQEALTQISDTEEKAFAPYNAMEKKITQKKKELEILDASLKSLEPLHKHLSSK
jgi:hypothetical protein